MPALALTILALGFLVAAPPAVAQEHPGRGAYLARLGDCTSCHTLPGGRPFAGGYPVNSPFGVIYGANITPDPEYGIGKYSLKDFTNAIRKGVTPDGTRLYPAMPYPSFARMSDDDVKALYDYFMHEVAPVHEPAPETRLPFPFNQRWAMYFWDWAFVDNKRFIPDPSRDAAWNRGAYIVQSLGHCGACHTPRGPAYEELGLSESSPSFLTGETLDYWYAANLRGDPASGLGGWSEEDIADFLGTGQSAVGIAFGNMAEVINHSSRYMTPEDRLAIAHYLKSLSPGGEHVSYHPIASPSPFELPGAGIYAGFCARCHGANGEGKPPRIPKLAGNAAVLAENPTSVIRIVLEGGATPGNDKPARMPGFYKRFTDREMASIVTFIRQSWGNGAPPVDERQVRRLREKVAARPEPSAATTRAPAPSVSPARSSSLPVPRE